MALAVYVIITWLVILCFTLLPKKLSFIENSFVFLIMSIIIKNSFTIVGLNLKWIESNKEPEIFLAYFLYRTIIYPFALLFLVNIVNTSNRSLPKYLTTISVIFFIFLVEILGEKLNIYTYNEWNNWYSITEIILFAYLSFLATKFIRYFSQRKYHHESI
ncbi:hypothetical protein IM538_12940 [Cytobacillus suaedae]|nr:hypothetical protein IM538_12940 [Cytobacillus suaedae]